MSINIQNVAVLGTGVLGSQIIMQNAWAGKNVVAYDISDEILAKLPERWEWLRGHYLKDIPHYSKELFDEAVTRITASTDLKQAVANADLVIEAVPEILDLKKQVWAEVNKAAPEHAIFVTNTSSLRPSDFMEATGRPEHFTTLHFANLVWRNNTGEVMRTPKTSDETFNTVLDFAKSINLVPIPIQKEVPGYLLNSLLIPFLNAAADLWVNGHASPEDIDNTWHVATKSAKSPFEMYDVVGFNVAYNINRARKGEAEGSFAWLLKHQIDKGVTGLASGKGFYLYDKEGNITGPNPDMVSPEAAAK
ncbi:MAG: 3-hydroxyacyl-CoA dehydrogenase [Mobiluncus porci]|uniref:3-hydroxyacyl-CoA dehydrogenase n=1 Tax=Mobiluncus porci TaxID=2652278 RepID=A0A7K0K0Y2_9ACTO|nr:MULTISPECIES: 3-hydroxyacyl-CoA dehydrogenase [Mobiluncus]MCI6585214.1 3-hydroxyacyl-CoA dehydrogenase [Mobiluncus sp.]MDD7541066.1 3-hydroxyacyl-CoA dehydrogenase [Mobiluncus porci]MDY5747525.1 3-hydroxyacyl-CoA dehydrogenase [Mobiluncus porci]MST49078.1 3-hydroxyacyl-CoA dehydrogenase [Mobiluncus porci]